MKTRPALPPEAHGGAVRADNLCRACREPGSFLPGVYLNVLLPSHRAGAREQLACWRIALLKCIGPAVAN